MYLNDKPNNMTNYQYAEDVARAAKSLRKHAEFVGLHWDQEPSDTSAYNDLIKMLQLSSQHVYTSTTIKPSWL